MTGKRSRGDWERPHVRSLDVSLRACCSAWFEEREEGSVEPGKQAGSVIPSDDISKMDPLEIAEIRILETINDGRTVCRLSEASQ